MVRRTTKIHARDEKNISAIGDTVEIIEVRTLSKKEWIVVKVIPEMEQKLASQQTLTTKQKLHLKGLAQHLKPVVLMGSNGLTDSVIAEIDNALAHHELIKIKIASEDRETKQLIIDNIVSATGATKVQTIGKILVLYKQSS